MSCVLLQNFCKHMSGDVGTMGLGLLNWLLWFKYIILIPVVLPVVVLMFAIKKNVKFNCNVTCLICNFKV